MPPFAGTELRFWLRKIALAVLVLVVTFSAAGLVQTPPSGLALFESQASAGAFAQPYGSPPPVMQPYSGVTATPRPTAKATPTPSPQLVCPAPSIKRRRGVPASWPIVIQIPSVGIDAAVELAAVDKHGDMQVPVNPCDVAWYKLGPVPGAAGDAVIDGHLDWWTDGAAVFWKLDKVRTGAEIDIIEAGGAKLRFKVTTRVSETRSTEPAGLFTTTGPPMLTLYTCAGIWEPGLETYSQRLFVDAVPVH